MPDREWMLGGTNLRILEQEISFRATRAGGPGGQHVNTSSTRVELWWNLAESMAFTEPQRALLGERLAKRLDGEGWIRLVAAGSRSQLRNREAVTERFFELVARSLRPPKPRRPTRVPKGERAKRLEGKRHRGGVKRMRGKVSGDE